MLDGRSAWWVGETPREVRACAFTGYRVREPERLQLRVVTASDEHLEDIWHAEDETTVVVAGFEVSPALGAEGERCDVPVHVWLDRPLGDRVVIDGHTGGQLPLAPDPWA